MLPTHTIGTVPVLMSASQAARWNSGTWTEQDRQEVRVVLPNGRALTLAEAWAADEGLSEYMAGKMARPV